MALADERLQEDSGERGGVASHWPVRREFTPDRRGILVVDDELHLRRLLCRALETAGYNVWEAHDGRHALRVAEDLGSRIHLLVTDVRMPEMGGYDLARELSRRRPDLRILYISGFSDSLPPPGAPFLQKPFRLEVLTREVERMFTHWRHTQRF